MSSRSSPPRSRPGTAQARAATAPRRRAASSAGVSTGGESAPLTTYSPYAGGTRQRGRQGGGDGAALSHRSAAELWELIPPSQGAIHVTVPASSGGRRKRHGLRIH